MQEETQEYADEAKLKELVTTYSQFIDFPIYLYTSKEVEVDAPEDAAEEAEDEEDVSDAEDVADEAGRASLALQAAAYKFIDLFGPLHMKGMST